MPRSTGSSLYLPVEAVTRVLDAVRHGRLPDEVTLQVLREVGTPDSVAPRTLRALENLGLLEPDGRPTDVLRKFATADDIEARRALASALKDAYADVFAAVGDVAVAPHEEIEAAFAHLEPATQRHRMVRLFLGLCQYAGLVEGRVRRGSSTSRARRAATRSSSVEEHTIRLSSGGEITVRLDVRLFALSADDRAFVMDLVDRVRSYGEEPT
jgi:hypothetical protein